MSHNYPLGQGSLAQKKPDTFLVGEEQREHLTLPKNPIPSPHDPRWLPADCLELRPLAQPSACQLQPRVAASVPTGGFHGWAPSAPRPAGNPGPRLAPDLPAPASAVSSRGSQWLLSHQVPRTPCCLLAPAAPGSSHRPRWLPFHHVASCERIRFLASSG